MMKFEYRVNNLNKYGYIESYESYDNELDALRAMRETAKKYKELGYIVFKDSDTVRVWERPYTLPIIYKLLKPHIEMG